MNRDEADRCFNIGKEHLRNNDYESALKFFQKSLKLENRDETISMIKQCQEQMKHKGEQQGSSHSHQNHRNHGDKSSHNTGTTAGGSSHTNTGTSAKSAELRKILGTKDFYEILQVPKTATEDEIKKSYRKLALKFHPDKNSEPGADEAFKKIAQAYDCLSTADKRRKYDEFGNEDPDQHYRHYRQYYSEDSFSPEDLFGMFFGNAFFQEGPNQRRYVYRTHRTGGGDGGENRQHQHQARNNGNFKLLPLLQFLPLLIIIISSFAFNLQSDEPAYSLVQNYKFNIERKTFNLKMPYFVDHSFQSGIGQNRKKLVTLEEGIERDYIKNLNHKCNTAKQRVYQFEQRAKNSRGATSQEYLNQAKRIDLSTCDELLKIKNKFPQLVGPSYYYY